MKKRIAINGFGRIGRLALRRILKQPNLEVVAINDLTDNDVLAHLFKYDSAHGKYPGTVGIDGDNIVIDGNPILGLMERDPSKLPWKDLQVDVVLECTGIFVTKEKASMHISAGAKKVILSAPGKGEDIQTIVLGVNEDDIDMSNNVFSNASCTTNCLAPVVKLIDQAYGVKKAMMTTVHAYTQDQNLQDGPHNDLRRARAAALNIVPTSTGAAKAVELVYPAIKGKMEASAVRVPVITGSLIDVTFQLEKAVSADEVNALFEEAANGRLKDIVEYCNEPIVSSDIVSNPHSAIFDAELTTSMGDFLKVVAWYDNEGGYATRLSDICALIASKL